MTEEAKIEQLFYMISETEEGRPFPLEEFKELLGSVPADKVDRWGIPKRDSFAVLTF